MGIKKHKPASPGTRFLMTNTFAEVTTDKPEKSLLAPMKSKGGRNNQGRMTSRYRGGGHKRRYRIIDFKRDKDGMKATVKTIEYDPNRSAYIALLEYTDGEKRYIIAPNGLQVGSEVVSGESAAPVTGNTLYLKDIPLGSTIHAIELRPSHGAAMARSAGTYCTLMGREGKYAVVKLPSGEVRRVLSSCKATIGTTSNPDHNLNPVDHPMGGGEGRASGGHPRSRNGQPAKGKKTRKPKKHSNKLIITKRKSGKRR